MGKQSHRNTKLRVELHHSELASLLALFLITKELYLIKQLKRTLWKVKSPKCNVLFFFQILPRHHLVPVCAVALACVQNTD